MRQSRSTRALDRGASLIRAGLPWLAAASLLLGAFAATAACNPETCDAAFACGFRECIGVTCETFFEEAGTTCRSAADVCDRAESCNGSSLGCPADAKRPASFVCRGAVDACDGAEHCDGSSAECPADVGVEPAISRVTLLDRGLRFGPITSPNRFFRIELLGEDLCEATVDAPDFIDPVDLASGETPPRLFTNLVYGGEPFESATYTFDVNRGAVAGTLEFVAGAPDGFIEILSPSTGATVGSDPTFSISNACSNCGIARAEISDDITLALVAETPDSFAPPPLATPTELGLGDFVGEPLPSGLLEGHYVFEAEGIDGALVEGQAFAGDTSGIHFTYLSGTSVRNKITFSVPEAAALPAALGAVAALAWRAAARCGRRPRR